MQKRPLDALSNAEIISCASAAEWEAWLNEHHKQSSGIWLLIAKRASPKKSVTISDALDVALCYGWIDSQRKSYDDNFYLQRYSPRRSKSPWSKINVERVENLIAAGRMQPAGLAEVAFAQADGRWSVAYERQRDAKLPEDVLAAREQSESARTAFAQLDRSAQYVAFLPVLKATTPAIRAARLQQMIAKLEGRT